MAGVMDSVNQRTQLVGQNRLELLLFRLGGHQLYGINVFKVKEVLQCPRLNAIPHRKPVVRGVAHIRGNTVSIIDLSLSIGRRALTDIDNSFVIITEYNRSTQGFLVQGVERIVNMHWEEIHPPPTGSGRDHYLTAVTEVDGQLVEIIDVEKVLAEVAPVSEEVSAGVIEDGIAERIVQKHVLIVDDSAVARKQIQRVVESMGMKTTVKKDGREAITYSALGRMVSALAHQIRTPLSAAMLYAGHLCDGQLAEDKRQSFSEKLLRRLNHMERQVQDMLVFVKGDMPLNDEITCAELQQGIEEETEVLLSSHGVSCTWRNSCPTHLLRCHKDALIGAVLNLINNAVQAGGSQVRIVISMNITASGDLNLAVIDDGPGIQAELLNTVKDVFVTTKAQGTGLGLSVVDTVAERHGGKFVLLSQPSQGTCAQLLLPLAPLTKYAAQVG